jgi:hypothetical protein
MRSLLNDRALLLSGVLVGAWCSVGLADVPRKEDATAARVLARTTRIYAECKTYRDSGVVRLEFSGEGTVAFKADKPFRTAFARPDRFRFEYKETRQGGQDSRYIVWRGGDEVQSWWDILPGIKKPPSLALALAGATGVSSGSAHTIPALLLPEEISGLRLTDLTGLRRLKDEKLGNVDCFRIEGEAVGQPMSLWIDRASHLVRRIDTQMRLQVQGKAVLCEQTTTYEPTVDGEIPAAELAFDPPAI